ncbi:hypothetical protein GCM10010873_30650 [Cypionkella aquatica]|uniref:Helix-turn-helix domain-containing protein n=1 Tax=Cypionkella aquatica TaxID=1756042 RepID=A0AA37UAY5_9RHOB|nr:helix-turn-helix domain-containing protein [Cypionkella aquatica]GLS88091.1 hypothetical protein GCM10010873_30650 [Cypionkella aquatica]
MDNSLRLIRDTEAAALLGCSRATFWRRVKDGTIAKPLRIGGLTRWRESDLARVIDKAAALSAPEVKLQPRERKRIMQ